MIKETKEKKVDKEGQKQQLNEETVKLRNAIEEQRKILAEKEFDYKRVMEENQIQKQEIFQSEQLIQEAKEKIRKKENDKLNHEKELADFNQNKQMIQS